MMILSALNLRSVFPTPAILRCAGLITAVACQFLLPNLLAADSQPGEAPRPASRPEVTKSAPLIQLKPASLDLGAVGHGRKYDKLSFQVRNSGDQQQSLSIRPSCGCMKLLGQPVLTLEPGEQKSVDFRLTLGRGWGTFSKRIDLVGAQQRVMASFPVKALFHPNVRTSAMEVVLTTSRDRSLPESSGRLIFNNSKGPAPVLTELQSADPRIVFKTVESVHPEQETILEVRSLPTWPAGRFSSQITGLCNGLPFILPVRGRAFGALVHEPHSWNLKQVRNTEISSETLIIRRADAKPLTILGMNVEWLRAVDGFRVELSQEALNDGSVKISVKALDPLPEVNKGFYGKVVLTTNVEEEPTIKIDLLGVIQLPRKGLR